MSGERPYLSERGTPGKCKSHRFAVRTRGIMRYVPKNLWWQKIVANRLGRRLVLRQVVQTGRGAYRPFLEALEDRWLPSGGLPGFFSNVPSGIYLAQATFTVPGGFLVIGPAASRA